MKMICNNCGEVFDDEDLTYEKEYVGECWGQPAYQEVAIPPCCGEYDCREAKCADCAHAVPYKPEEYEDAYTCDLDGGAVECFDEACAWFELKEKEETK